MDLPHDTPSVNEVRTPHEGFTRWVKENNDRLERMRLNGKLPFFIKDNDTQLRLLNVSSRDWRLAYEHPKTGDKVIVVAKERKTLNEMLENELYMKRRCLCVRY